MQPEYIFNTSHWGRISVYADVTAEAIQEMTANYAKQLVLLRGIHLPKIPFTFSPKVEVEHSGRHVPSMKPD